jgi:hypothetical protein
MGMSIENYMRAKAELDKASVELERTQRLLTKVSAMLTEPVDFDFSGTSCSPPGAGLTFDAGEFPSAETMQMQIIRWRDRLSAALAAWAALDPTLRSKLVPPLGSSYFDEFSNWRSKSRAE